MEKSHGNRVGNRLEEGHVQLMNCTTHDFIVINTPS